MSWSSKLKQTEGGEPLYKQMRWVLILRLDFYTFWSTVERVKFFGYNLEALMKIGANFQLQLCPFARRRKQVVKEVRVEEVIESSNLPSYKELIYSYSFSGAWSDFRFTHITLDPCTSSIGLFLIYKCVICGGWANEWSCGTWEGVEGLEASMVDQSPNPFQASDTAN